MLRASGSQTPEILLGEHTVAGLPSAAANNHRIAWVTDRLGGAGFMFSDGSTWRMPNRRTEVYIGTTNGGGDFVVAYGAEYPTVPSVQPQTHPPADAITRVRVSASSTAGFTVRTERNETVSVLGIDVLSLGTAAVASVPVRVLVTEST